MVEQNGVRIPEQINKHLDSETIFKGNNKMHWDFEFNERQKGTERRADLVLEGGNKMTIHVAYMACTRERNVGKSSRKVTLKSIKHSLLI